MDFSSFDIFQYLDTKTIPYLESGKNISSGRWIGINCPFCDDPSNHLGINLQSKNFSCFKCGMKGNIILLIQEISQVPIQKAFQIFYQFQDKSLSYLDKEEIPTNYGMSLPKGCSKNFAGIFTNYLLSRNFNPQELIKEYDLYCCHTIGDFKFRIIAPVYYQYELITYTGRDVTGNAKSKYLHCSNEESIIPIKNTLYNIDSIKDKAIIVEGITDVWKLGKGSIATFGTQHTKKQLALLSGIDKVYILFDAEASKEAENLANNLLCITKKVDVLYLEKGDPADMFPLEALKLKKKLGF